MINKNDFLAKKIVIIGSHGDLPNELHFQNDNIRLLRGGEAVDQISCYLVFCVFILGSYTITDQLLKNLKQYGINLFLMGATYKINAAFYANGDGNYLLRQQQYNLNVEEEFFISKRIVTNKVNNQLKLIDADKKSLDEANKKIDAAKNRQQLLGIEGNYSKEFFGNFFSDCDWYRRAPQTKEDENNLLLDLGYSMLFNYISALLRLFGFDTYKGFYHQLFFQRESLTCDIVEPFRCVIDKSLKKIHNLKQLQKKDFIYQNDAYAFTDFNVTKKYMNIFSKEISHYQSEIYKYVVDFYYHFMKKQYFWKDFEIC
jgi:CRISPR-associated protein Cas1